MNLLENMYVSEHVLSAGRPFISMKKEKERYNRYKAMLSIKANSEKDAVTSLSGGNQQKVFLARWLNTEADVLLLDNPTQGIDVGAKAELYKLILELAKKRQDHFNQYAGDSGDSEGGGFLCGFL